MDHPYMMSVWPVVAVTLLQWLCYVCDATALPPVVIGNLTIRPGQEEGVLPHFWKSTGFCPPAPHQNASTWLLSRDMGHNLAYIGALPYNGIQQVRIHWLLDTVTFYRYIPGYDKSPVYDWSTLNEIMDLLKGNYLKPHVELMGNPSNMFTDFQNHTQVFWWKELVKKFATVFMGRYGLEYVQTWNFETWNEPRRNGDFDNLNFTIAGFLNYYDACSAGLREAHPSLILGGPGGECHELRDSSYCWALLNHTQHGTDFFSGQTGVRIDYVAIHKKGYEPTNTATILQKTDETYAILKRYFPGLTARPIYNDEADPLVTWSRERWWRADVTYAAMVVKIIDGHLKHYITNSSSSVNFTLLSNDNGFLSYNPAFFTQRTLLARFQMNRTRPAHVQFIRKPVYVAMGLLALLGDTRIYANLTLDNMATHGDSRDVFGVIATVRHPTTNPSDGWTQTVVVYASDDTHNTTSELIITVPHLYNTSQMTNITDVYMTAYRMDNLLTNPYIVWVKAGRPSEPSRDLFAAMRGMESPRRLVDPTPVQYAPDTFALPLPGLLLIHLCQKSPQPPGRPFYVWPKKITFGTMLLVWTDEQVISRCITTYVIERTSNPWTGPFVRVNVEDERFNSFVYAPEEYNTTEDPTIGYYRVRAIDYFGRLSPFSDTVYHRG